MFLFLLCAQLAARLAASVALCMVLATHRLDVNTASAGARAQLRLRSGLQSWMKPWALSLSELVRESASSIGARNVLSREGLAFFSLRRVLDHLS